MSLRVFSQLFTGYDQLPLEDPSLTSTVTDCTLELYAKKKNKTRQNKKTLAYIFGQDILCQLQK